MMHDSCFASTTSILDLPRVTLLVMDELGSIVTLVQVFKDC